MEAGLFRNARVPSEIRFHGTWLALRVPEDDPTVLSPLIEVLLDDCYGVRRVKDATRILDIGGHVGLFSVLARLAHPSAQVDCYEPNPRLWPYLRHQATEAGFNAFPEAVGSRAARISIEYRETGVEGSIHSRTHEDEQGSGRQISFDEAVKRMGGTIDLAKVDCEGAEWSFLDSPAWNNVSRVAMEYHLWPAHTHDEARGALERLRFRITRQDRHDGFGLLWGVR
jgi:FkbM family methyltransferase